MLEETLRSKGWASWLVGWLVGCLITSSHPFVPSFPIVNILFHATTNTSIDSIYYIDFWVLSETTSHWITIVHFDSNSYQWWCTLTHTENNLNFEAMCIGETNVCTFHLLHIVYRYKALNRYICIHVIELVRNDGCQIIR